MKSKIYVLIAFVFFAQTAMAQINFGIKGGLNLTKIDDKAFKDEFRYGYHVGGFAEIGLGKKFGIQPEVLFNQYETKVDTSLVNIWNPLKTDQDAKLNYLSIPILINYKLANIITLQAGPQVGVLISQDKNLLENGQEAFKTGDFSLLGGATINISKLRFTGRYFVGLNDIGDVGNQNEWKNQGWQLSLGLAF
ncbi:MAG TPA: porin family protein [Flavisolibacter sp.]|nr:porin family protein [Flavisolibacter sp.]